MANYIFSHDKLTTASSNFDCLQFGKNFDLLINSKYSLKLKQHANFPFLIFIYLTPPSKMTHFSHSKQLFSTLQLTRTCFENTRINAIDSEVYVYGCVSNQKWRFSIYCARDFQIVHCWFGTQWSWSFDIDVHTLFIILNIHTFIQISIKILSFSK